jgi:hypothetical protein
MGLGKNRNERNASTEPEGGIAHTPVAVYLASLRLYDWPILKAAVISAHSIT